MKSSNTSSAAICDKVERLTCFVLISLCMYCATRLSLVSVTSLNHSPNHVIDIMYNIVCRVGTNECRVTWHVDLYGFAGAESVLGLRCACL